MLTCLVNCNLGKVNLKISLVHQQSSPRQAGLCRLPGLQGIPYDCITQLSLLCFAAALQNNFDQYFKKKTVYLFRVEPGCRQL